MTFGLDKYASLNKQTRHLTTESVDSESIMFFIVKALAYLAFLPVMNKKEFYNFYSWWPCSPEFINYGLALLVFAVRYPAVFWNTNKGFSFLFSFQLLANSIQVKSRAQRCKTFYVCNLQMFIIS